jgi:hypothetical protein
MARSLTQRLAFGTLSPPVNLFFVATKGIQTPNWVVRLLGAIYKILNLMDPTPIYINCN